MDNTSCRLRLKGQQYMMAILIRPKSLADRGSRTRQGHLQVRLGSPRPAQTWQVIYALRGACVGLTDCSRFNPSRVFPKSVNLFTGAASAHNSSRLRITVFQVSPCRCAYFSSLPRSFINSFVYLSFISVSIFPRSVPTVVTLLLFSVESIYFLTLSFCDSNSPQQ